MNTHHFYGTNRAGKGGLNIGDDAIHPNADYWKNSANAALVRLMDIVGDEKARTMTSHIEGTWREIRDAITAIEELAIQRDEAVEGMKLMLSIKEIASNDAVFGSGVTHIINPATNGTIRFGSESPEFGSAEWFDGIKEIPL